MSTTVDQRVVQMQFDNKQFERNVSTTMSTLDKLKQSLNLSGASKGLESVGTAARGINLQPLGSAVETVGLKFNALWTIADQALRNITNSAYNAGKRIASALTIDPIKTGFQEYETQINAVQTILANTSSKGTTIDDVNAALDTLNEYADKTIYNFTEMTRNIGTFTAAGVDLQTSTTAIQGIANLAAVSGSTSQQASTAMYQLSQALSSGTVKLMDWNSVVNAGMGGQVFQDALKATSRQMVENAKSLSKMSEAEKKAYQESHGYTTEQMKAMQNYKFDVDALIKKNGSFRESLQAGWITADVLTMTLGKMTKTGVIDYVADMAGVSKESVTELQKLGDTYGYDSEQAKKLADSMADGNETMSKSIIETLKMATTAEDAATKVKTFSQLWDTLKEAAQSGWTQTWEIIVGDFEEAKALLTEVSNVLGEMIGNSANARNELLQGWKDAGGRADLIEGIRHAFNGLMNIITPIKEALRDIFPPTTVAQLTGFTSSFKNLMATFEEFTSSHGDQIYSTFKGIFSVVEIGWEFIKQLAEGIVELIGHFSGFSGGLLEASASIGDWLNNLRETVKETDIFGVAIDRVVGFLGRVIDKIKDFGKSTKEYFASHRFEGFLSFFQGLWNVMKQIGSKLITIFSPIIDGIVNVFTSTTFMDILDSGLLAGILAAIVGFGDKLTGPLQGITDIFESVAGEGGVISGVKDVLDGVKGSLEAYQNSLKADVLQKIAIAIGILAASILVISSIDADALDHSLGAMAIMFGELMGSLAIFTKLSPKLNGVAKAVGIMIGMSIAIVILAGAMKKISSLDWEGIGKGLVGVGALMAELFLFMQFAKFDGKMTATALGIVLLSTAMLIMAKAVKNFATMSWEEIGKGLAAVGALLLEIGLFTKLTGNAKHVISTGLAMVLLGASMKILASALKDFATMSWEDIGRGLSAMGGALAELAIALKIANGSFGGAASLLIASAALAVLVPVLKSLGEMGWDEIGRGLVAMGGALAELAIALNLMNGAVAGSAALIIAAGALAIIAPVMKSLGQLSWEQIGKGLVTLAGAFTIIGVAGLLLTPLIPTLLGLAGAFVLFGVSTLAIGAGLALIGAGITALATSLAVGATAIVAGLAGIIGGIVELIPTVILGLGDAILAVCTVIKECAPAIVDTIFVLLAEVCTSLATYVPMIGNALFDLLIGALDVLTERMPELIAAAVDTISAFFSGIADAVSGMDTSGLLKGIIGFAIVSALAYALSGLAALIPGAMLGVIGVGALIAEIALVIAAIGALAQIPGLSWLIEEGGDLLQTIGTAIGQFIGGIVGGVAEGATSTLPQVGTNLSDFMNNLQGFITGAQSIDSSILENVTTLAGAILALTGANLLDSITSWLTGGSSLSQFAADLVPFGKSMKQYAAEVAGIDAASITNSVTAAKGLVAVAQAIPGDGMFGTDGIDDFGRNVVTFGKSMKKYAEEVAELNATAVIGSVNAARGLVQVARLIPDDGTFGGDGIDNFGKDIVSFAKSLKKYAEEVADVNSSSISASASAVRTLISTINSMASLDSSGVSSFKKAVNDLSKVNVNSVVEAFEGASSKLSGIGSKMINSIANGLKSNSSALTSTVNSIVLVLTNSLTGAVNKFGNVGSQFISEMASGISKQRAKVTAAMRSIINAAVTSTRGYYSSFYSAGNYLGDGLIIGINSKKSAAYWAGYALGQAAVQGEKDGQRSASPSKLTIQAGKWLGEGLVIGMNQMTNSVYNAGRSMGQEAIGSISNSVSKISDLVASDMDAQPTIRPVLDLSDVRAGASTIGSMFGGSTLGLSTVGSISTMMNRRGQNGGTNEVVSAIDKLRKDLGNVGNTSYNINGITYDRGSELDDALRTIVRYAKIEGRV